jgi:hypothetical protein
MHRGPDQFSGSAFPDSHGAGKKIQLPQSALEGCVVRWALVGMRVVRWSHSHLKVQII